MYSYKINNSYTIYVNHVYLNECIKAGKKAEARKKQQKENFEKFKTTYFPDTIKVGSKVTLLDVDSGERRTVTILSTKDFRPSAYTASEDSPIGKALVGHQIGDRVSVVVPAGVVRYKILGF